MAGPRFETQKLRLTAEHVRKALAIVASRKTGGKTIEWRDDKTPGLVLRITSTAATWYVRKRKTTVRIGTAENVPLENARLATHQVHFRLKDTTGTSKAKNVSAFASIYARTLDSEDELVALVVADHYSNPDAGCGVGEASDTPWTWSQMRDAFLGDKLPKLKATYRHDYRAALFHPAFDEVANMRVCDVKLRHLEPIRDRIIKQNTLSAAHHSVQIAKAMLSWAWELHSVKAGLENVEADWWQRRWKVQYRAQVRSRCPSIAELARTLAVAEVYRTLGGAEHATAPGTMAALWMVVLTGQRTGALTVLRRNRIFDLPDKPGWASANWSAEEMKGGPSGGKPHALPLPPAALAVLDRFWSERREAWNRRFPFERYRESQFVFPSGKNSDGPVTQDGLNRLLYRLQGRMFEKKARGHAPWRKGKPGPKPKTPRGRDDLFARHRIEVWTPHDVRRAIGTFLDDRGLGGAASAIFGHTVSKETDEKLKMADVTRIHYSRAQKIELKAQGLSLSGSKPSCSSIGRSFQRWNARRLQRN